MVCIIDGSEPAPPSTAGSVIRKAERARPSTMGLRKRSFISGLPTLPSRYMLPSSGAAVFTATGPNGDSPDAFRTVAVSRWLRWLPSGKDVRREYARRARFLAQFGDQRIGRAVAVATRILLIRHDDVANEGLHARGDLRSLRSPYALI